MKSCDYIEIDHGGGGHKSAELIGEIKKILNFEGEWKNCHDDSAVYDFAEKSQSDANQKIFFTTDAYIVDPIFFPGGDIGKIAMCGTINDLSVMGARPIGLALSMVIEEGFPKKDFFKIVSSIGKISKSANVPIVTGDTKVTEKGKIDKIEITTSGVGLANKIIENKGAQVGDVIISSGDLGEHSVVLLAQRFNYQIQLASDCMAFNKEIEQVGKHLNACKDPTRGGLAANIIEIAEKSNVKIVLKEKNLPYKKEVVSISEMLGIEIFSLASEGRFIAAVNPKNKKTVLDILRKTNPEAKVIGEVQKGQGVFLQTSLGSLRPIENPRGKLIPRIC